MAIRTCSLFLAGWIAAAPLASFSATPGDILFDDTTVQVISLTIDQAQWSTLQEHVRENTYYHAGFEWNGVVLRDIGIRSHGGVSRLATKPNLDLDFAKYQKNQRVTGLSFVVLKANNRDPSNLREWISFQLFRKMDFPAPREAPARVLLNGQLLGMYMIVEHVDEHFLEQNFKAGGFLYKWRNRTGYEFDDFGASPEPYRPMLELKSRRGAGDWQRFANLVQVIHSPDAPGFILSLSRYLDPGRFLAYLATENVLSEGDGMAGGLVGMNNFYLYQERPERAYQLIPWDKDLTFSWLERGAMEGITGGSSINLLAERLAGIPEWRTTYLDALVKAANLLGGTDGWADREITREAAVIHDLAIEDPNKWCFDHACGPEQYESDVRWLHGFLSERARNVLESVRQAR